MATVILLTVLVTITVVHATNTEHMSVVRAIALVSNQAGTATTTLVEITHTMNPATSTERTWDILALVRMGLKFLVVTVILLIAPIMLTMALATNTEYMSVILAVAQVSDQVGIASTTLVEITRIMGPAMSTERTSELQARVLMGLYHPMATVILLTVRVTLTIVLATNTRSTSIARIIALG